MLFIFLGTLHTLLGKKRKTGLETLGNKAFIH